MAKLVKPNVIRGEIFDKLAGAFGNSVLGMYDKKLRIEIIDEATGDVIQFSLAPVIHKDLVDAEDCDKLVPIADQLAAYEAEKAKKDADAEAKKAAKNADKNKGKGKGKDKKENFEGESDPTTPPVATGENVAVELTDEEKAKLEDLNAMLANGGF